MPQPQPSATAPARPEGARPKSGRSIVPIVRDTIADLSVNTGHCFAGDVALARIVGERIGRSVTDRRIRQAIAELRDDGQIVVERGARGRQLRVVEGEHQSPISDRKFPDTGRDRKTSTDTQTTNTDRLTNTTPFTVCLIDLGKITPAAPRHPTDVLLDRQAREDMRRYQARMNARKSAPPRPKGWTPFVKDNSLPPLTPKVEFWTANAPVQTPPTSSPPRQAPVSPPEPALRPDTPHGQANANWPSERCTECPKEAADEATIGGPGADLVAKLGGYGIGTKTAHDLLGQYGPVRVAVVVSIVEYAVAKGKRTGKPIDSPAGLAIRALAQGWEPTPEQVASEDRQHQSRQREREIDAGSRRRAVQRSQDAKVDEYLESQGWPGCRDLEVPALAAFPVPEGLAPVMRKLYVIGAVKSYARVQIGLPPEDVEPSTRLRWPRTGGAWTWPS